jgi:hypothetical protein
MLDSRGGGASSSPGLQDDEPAGGYTSPNSNGKRAGTSESKSGFDNTLNDDIPF